MRTPLTKEAWTLALGRGMQMQAESVQSGVAGIQNYLLQKQVIRDSFSPPRKTSGMYCTRTSQIQKYSAGHGGLIHFAVTLGDLVEPGQLLYRLLCLNKQGQMPASMEVFAAHPGIVYDLALID